MHRKTIKQEELKHLRNPDNITHYQKIFLVVKKEKKKNYNYNIMILYEREDSRLWFSRKSETFIMTEIMETVCQILFF